MIFVTADHHFGHARIIELCSRPYATVEWMNAHLIREWNSVVNFDDEVWHLGDFGLGPRDALRDIAKSLNGQCRIIRGNHDHSRKFMTEIGFDPLEPTQEFQGTPILLSHRPPDDMAVRTHLRQGYWWLHGHSHGRGRKVHPHVIDVGVDCWNYRPVPLTEVLDTY